jgi:hypothetical protein
MSASEREELDALEDFMAYFGVTEMTESEFNRLVELRRIADDFGTSDTVTE